MPYTHIYTYKLVESFTYSWSWEVFNGVLVSYPACRSCLICHRGCTRLHVMGVRVEDFRTCVCQPIAHFRLANVLFFRPCVSPFRKREHLVRWAVFLSTNLAWNCTSWGYEFHMHKLCKSDGLLSLPFTCMHASGCASVRTADRCMASVWSV